MMNRSARKKQAELEERKRLRQGLTEAIEAKEEALSEPASSDWISSKPSSQAVMMAVKHQSRMSKGKSFNGFVLEQRSSKDNELAEFLTLLQTNASHIPPGTRMHLAVLTSYVDPKWDADFYNKNLREANHWTAVDVWIDKNGQVNSFVLDAANAVGHDGIRARLEEKFPAGKHYVFKSDQVIIDEKEKTRAIQTQMAGCHVFVTEHLKQLSQIPPEILYEKELPAFSTNNMVKPGNFVGHQSKLSRIFRGMQSWTSLTSLGPEVLSSPIKADGTTLEQSAKSYSVEAKSTSYNNTIVEKNKRYKAKKNAFVTELTEKDQLETKEHLKTMTAMMEQRQGFTFLKHPVLFKLNDLMAESKDINHVTTFLSTFSETLEKSVPKQKRGLAFFSKASNLPHVMKTITDLKTLKFTADMKPEEIAANKNKILLSVASLARTLDLQKSVRTTLILSQTLNETMPILEGQQMKAAKRK